MQSGRAIQDQIRERITLSDIIGKRVKLKRAGKEFSGLCPFHGEKTPSFTVNDQKGFFHCFGCGAHGDVFGFLMQEGGVSFPEALKRAAEIAGVQLPKTIDTGPKLSPAQLQARDRLHQLMRHAADFYSETLKRHEATEAQKYLQSRNLTAQTISAFQVGFASSGRTVLMEYLKTQGFTAEEIKTAGLTSARDQGTIDKFRSRIIFPIHNTKGQVVAFGGRALLSQQEPKYLNSPETPIFHKGSLLYNAKNANDARSNQSVLLVEGYMDVIKLSQAGYPRAVAPLGTAVTPEQITALWRLDRSPIIVMDGDNAGIRAQQRIIERAMPLITADKTLRFLTLPQGQDPDTFIDAHGIAAFQNLLSQANSLIDQLWQLYFLATPQDTPEQRTQIQRTLADLINAIRDPSLRKNYQDDIAARTKQHRYKAQQPSATQISPRSTRKKGTPSLDLNRRILLYLSIRYPSLLFDHEEDFSNIDFPTSHQGLQQDCLSLCATQHPIAVDGWLSHIKSTSPHHDILSDFDHTFVRSHLPTLQVNPQPATLDALWQKTIQALHQEKQVHLAEEMRQKFESNPTEENWQLFLKHTEGDQ